MTLLQRSVIVSLSLCLTLSAAHPALAAKPAAPGIATTQQQPRPRMLQRMQVRLGRFWSAAKQRTSAWATRWSVGRPVGPDRHLQPLRQMLRSGRISPGDYDRVMHTLGQPQRVDEAAQARQRLERASQQKKHLRPLVRMIQRGELSDSDVVRVGRLLGK